MALKAMMLRRSIDRKKQALADLREKDNDLQTREKELETAINEAETEEEQQAVAEEVEAFEAEKAKHQQDVQALEDEITGQETELAAVEAAAPAPNAAARNRGTTPNTNKEERTMINIRSLPMSQRAFDALPMEQRQNIVKQPDVQQFFAELRAASKAQRAISGGSLTIPVVFLDLISENMYRYSKLLNRVRVRNVSGEARQTIAGTVPEAVWTEMCGAINELDFVFNQITLDGYKVAGYVPVCNSLLEDNDVNLASWIVEMLSEAIGLAIDKAILYGKGPASKMPLGIVTRLAQQTRPSDYPANAPAWVDLHTTNIQQISASLTGAEFWAALMLATGNTFTRYNRGRQFWAMNSKTYATLKSKVITFTASGDVAANIFGTLPIIGGDVDVLEFIPDGDIIGGYGDLYLWAQRSGMQIELSREVQFIQDNTVFRGKERADGTPVIPGAFVAININGAAPTTSIPFAADTANDAALNGLTVGALALTPAFDANVLTYAVTATAATAAVTATPANAGAKVAISYNGKNVTNGGTVTFATGTLPMTITVSNGNAVRVYTVNVTRSDN